MTLPHMANLERVGRGAVDPGVADFGGDQRQIGLVRLDGGDEVVEGICTQQS